MKKLSSLLVALFLAAAVSHASTPTSTITPSNTPSNTATPTFTFTPSNTPTPTKTPNTLPNQYTALDKTCVVLLTDCGTQVHGFADVNTDFIRIGNEIYPFKHICKVYAGTACTGPTPVATPQYLATLLTGLNGQCMNVNTQCGSQAKGYGDVNFTSTTDYSQDYIGIGTIVYPANEICKIVTSTACTQ